jgi:hypothetical protein
MIRDDQFIGRLEDYLDAFDGATPLPDRVRDAVHEALPSVHQVRRSPVPLWRLGGAGDRSIAAGWALIAAALIVAIGAGTILNFNRLFEPAATPSPTVSPAPSASAIATVPPVAPGTLLNDGLYRSCGRGGQPAACLTAGTYVLGNGLLGTTVTVVVPTGWFEWDPGTGTQGLLVHRSLDGSEASGWGVIFSSIGSVSRDPCNLAKGTVPADQTKTVDGLIGAMARWPGFHVGRSKPVVIGGVQGQQVQVTATPTQATCANATTWTTPQGTPVDGYPMVAERPDAYPAQFIVLDVNGELLVLRSTDFPQPSPLEVSQGRPADPGRHRTDQATLHEILDSIRFGGRT